MVVELAEEKYRRVQASFADKHSSFKDEGQHVVEFLTSYIIEEHGELINQISRGEKPQSLLERIVYKTIVDKKILVGNPSTTAKDTCSAVMDYVLGYWHLQPYIDDPEITDIFVNGPQNVYYRKYNRDIHAPEASFKDDNHVLFFIRALFTRFGRKINMEEPLADARDLKNNIRINAGIPPVAKTPYIAIRKHIVRNFTENDFLQNKTFSPEILTFLKKAFDARLNIAFAGPTGSGKTTLLRFFVENFVPKDQRIVVIEEEEELKLNHDNMVVLEAKKGMGEDDTTLELDDLVKNSLRMAMRRIILGELRGKEAFALIRAFGTGHDGSVVTLHANSTFNTLEQLAVMMLLGRPPLNYNNLMRVISQGINLIVLIRNYKIEEISSLDGFNESEQLPVVNLIYRLEKNPEGEPFYQFYGISESLKQLFYRRGVVV